MAGRGNIKNLRPPWKPGESGNPSGRPKKRPMSDAYGEYAERLLPEKFRLELSLEEGATFAEAVTQGLFLSAMKGNVPAARELREGSEGKADVRPKDAPGEVRFKVVYERTVRVKKQSEPEDSGGDGSGNGAA
jgi:hypothetical protein